LDDQKNIDANHHDDNTLIMPTKTAESEQLGPKYPYYPLANALKTAEAVKDLGGARAPVKKSLLAKQLSPNNWHQHAPLGFLRAGVISN
jgi:hypothetical protein